MQERSLALIKPRSRIYADLATRLPGAPQGSISDRNMGLNGLLSLHCVFYLCSKKVQIKNLIVGYDQSEALMVCGELFCHSISRLFPELINRWNQRNLVEFRVIDQQHVIIGRWDLVWITFS